jgi:hypothetical protein
LEVLGKEDGKENGGKKGYWNQVKVFSAFFEWTLPSQYRFFNLERLFIVFYSQL